MSNETSQAFCVLPQLPLGVEEIVSGDWVPALLGAVSALEPAGAAPGPDPVPCAAAPLVTGAALSRAAMSRALAQMRQASR